MQKLEFSVKQLCIVKSAILQTQQTLGFITASVSAWAAAELHRSWEKHGAQTTSSVWAPALIYMHWFNSTAVYIFLERDVSLSLCVCSVSLTCSPWSLRRRAWRATRAAASLAPVYWGYFPRGRLHRQIWHRPWIWPRERKVRRKMWVRQNTTSVKNSEERSAINNWHQSYF